MKYLEQFRNNFWLLIILIFAAFFRFYHLGYQSAWLDEVLNLKQSEPSLPFNETYKIVLLRDSTSFLYTFLIKYLSFLSGHSIYTARLISAVSGVLSVYYIFKLGEKMISKNMGYIAAILLTINLYHIEYSQEARSYSLFVLFVIISFYIMYLFIEKPNYKNAIFLGIVAGLATNTHSLGILNIAAIYLFLLLFLLLNNDRKEKLKLFFKTVISGLITLSIFYLISPLILAASKITSFWIPDASYETIKQALVDLAGKSEKILIIIIISFIFVSIHVLIINKIKKDIKNKLFISYLVLLIWIFTVLGVVIAKSYLGVSIILSRYIITIMIVFILLIAIAIDLLPKIMKYVVTLLFVLYSFYILFFDTNYYTTIKKAEFDKTAAFLNEKNINNDKVISRYGWVLSYCVNSNNPNTIVIENSFDNHVSSMKNELIPMESFWYFDGNSAPYSLSLENQKFLNKEFTLKDSKDMYDCWVRHYVLKGEVQKIVLTPNELSLKDFSSGISDGNGNLFMFENGTITSKELLFDSGKYEFTIEANSIPDKPIDGENAHILIMLNNIKIGDKQLSEKTNNKTQKFTFINLDKKAKKITIVFDNDLSKDNLDRNLVIYNVKLKKSEN